MLIRSQDRKQITNFDNYNGVAISYQSECDFAVCTVLEVDAERISHVLLGNYSTEAKAIKVLDMIQKAYLSGTEVIIDQIVCKVMPRNVVFQMPANEEVEG